MPLFLVGDNAPGGQILTGKGDYSIVANEGELRLPIVAGYTGRVTGYIGSTHVNRNDISAEGLLNGRLGPAKQLTHCTERNRYKLRSVVQDLIIMPVSWTMTDATTPDDATYAGPLGYTVEYVGTGEYTLKFLFDIPRRGRWVVAGVTDLGKTISVAPGSIDPGAPDQDTFTLRVKAAGAPADLAADEQVTLMLMGPSTDVAFFGARGGAGGTRNRENYCGRFPVHGMVRDPIFDPFTFDTSATGEVGTGSESYCPPGTAIIQRGGALENYDYNVGTAAKRANQSGLYNTWATAGAIAVGDPATFGFNAGAIDTDAQIVLQGSAPIAAAGQLCGYAFLSGNKEQ